MCNTSSAQLSSQTHRTRPTLPDSVLIRHLCCGSSSSLLVHAISAVCFCTAKSSQHITQASMHKNKSLSRAPIVHKYKYTFCDRHKNNTVAIRLAAGHSRRVYSVTERVLSFKIDIPSSVTVAVVATSRKSVLTRVKTNTVSTYFVRK